MVEMSKRHILVVEDDAGIQAVTKFCLEMEDFWRVTTAFTGREGLTEVTNCHPNVILLDLNIPDLSGLGVIHELQSNRQTAKIPIILFTAKLSESAALAEENYNVVGVITKPFDCLTLSERILYLLEHIHQSKSDNQQANKYSGRYIRSH